jgi:hypothetical protein
MPPVVSYTVRSSAREAGLGFQFRDGGSLQITFRGGQVLMDGATVGAYQPGGALDRQWRQFLAWAGTAGADEAVAVARAWKPEGLEGNEAQVVETVKARLNQLVPINAVAPPAQPAPDADLEAQIAAAAEAAREAEVAAEVARGIGRDVGDRVRRSIQESMRNQIRIDAEPQVWVSSESRLSPVGAVFSGVLGLLGTFVALTAIAFGVSFFAGRQLDVVADTVSTSLVRSFFVGLFAQPLIIPAFGAMIAGLTLTVIGILVIPVAAIGFVVALLAAALGGYLAVARVAGSAWIRRRTGDHGVEGFGILRSVAWGLAILLAVWLPAAVLGWVPVAGTLLTWCAAVFTWMLMTTGFGAALLTRGGVRTSFGRRFQPPALPPSTLFESPAPEISTGEWLGKK